MPQSPLTIRQVEAFRAFMQFRSVTRAAEHLYITQPAMSRLLSDCEESAGFALFERGLGRLLPTAEARVLYDEVKRTFLALERIIQVTEQIRAQRLGALHIAGAPSIALNCLPAAIADFTQAHPGIEVTLLADTSRAVLELVAGQNYDICLVAEAIPYPGVQLKQIYESPMVCVLPLAHPLAAKPVISPEDLADELFVSYPEPNDARAAIDQVFFAHGVSRRMLYESQLSHTIIAMVEHGVGVALVNPLCAHFARGNVAIRPFEPAIPRRIFLATTKTQSISPLGAAFMAIVQRQLGAVPIP